MEFIDTQSKTAITVIVLACLSSIATGCDEPTPDQRVADTMRRVEDIRGLERLGDVPSRFLGADAAFVDLLAELDDSETAAKIVAEALVRERLGLLPPGVDIIDLARRSTVSSVLGYYDHETKETTVVDEDGTVGPDELMVLAHEHAHALQDQHRDLGARMEGLDGDELIALDALIEGEATIVMYVWAIKRLSVFDWEEIEELEESDIPSDYVPLESVPPVLSREGEFPYVDGAAFVYQAWELGGWEAVEEMWEAPPRSSEQIMHPERYPDDEPIAVEMPDVAGRLGPGWSTATEMTMGELEISVLLAGDGEWDYGDEDEVFVLPQAPNAWAAEGWGGDRLVHVEGPDGAWAVVWQTTWDSRPDASEFVAVASVALGGVATDGGYVSRVHDGADISANGQVHPVLVLVASDVETYGNIIGELDVL